MGKSYLTLNLFATRTNYLDIEIVFAYVSIFAGLWPPFNDTTSCCFRCRYVFVTLFFTVRVIVESSIVNEDLYLPTNGIATAHIVVEFNWWFQNKIHALILSLNWRFQKEKEKEKKNRLWRWTTIVRSWGIK